MTRLRPVRLVLVLAAVLVPAAVAVVWLVPPMLDWNRYRDDIAALVSRGIGRAVRITGDVSLSLLPEPVLTASGMTVADSGDGITLRADSLRLRVALGALLAGRVDARELVLGGADLRVPWPPAPGALAQRPPAWLSGLQARVESSRLQVGNVTFTDIAATLATDPDTGTLSANGSGKLAGQSWRVIARLSEPGRDGSAALDASVDGEDQLRDTGGTFSGQIGADGALSGRATARGSNLSLLIPAPALPWTGEGRLTAAAGLAVADELQVVLAGVPARGAVALRVGADARLDIAITSNRLDGDAWWPVLLRGAAPSLPTGVDLSAEAVPFAGGQLRRVRVGLDLGPDGATIREASAELPGQAALTLAGNAARDGGFSGTGRLSAPDLRTTLGWLDQDVPGLAAMRPPGTFQSAQLAAGITAGSGTVTLSDLKGTLDGATVSGSVALRFGARPTFTGDLQTEHVVLDPWLPSPDPHQLLEHVARRFAAFDLGLKVHARAATWRGLPVPSADLDLSAESGRIALRHMAAALRGIRIAASGTLNEGFRLTDGIFDAQADDASPLATFLSPAWSSLAALLRGPATLTLRAAGPPDSLALHIVAEASDLHLDASPILDTTSGRAAGPVTLHHPGAPRLLRTFGLEQLAAAVGDGSFAFLTQLAATPGEFRFDPFQLSAGSARITGQLDAALSDTPMLSGRIIAETLPLPPGLAAADPLPTNLLLGWRAALRLDATTLTFAGQSLAENAGADAVLANGRLTLAHGAATILGAPARFTASADATADPPAFAVNGTVDAGSLPGLASATVTLRADSVAAQFDLHASGHSPSALLTTLAGEAGFRLRDGVLHGLDLAAASRAAAAIDQPLTAVLAAVRTALTGGDGPFTELHVGTVFAAGVARFRDTTLTDDAGVASVTGTVYLPTATVDAQIARPSSATAPAYAVDLTGNYPELTRTPELAGLARQLAEAPPEAPPEAPR